MRRTITTAGCLLVAAALLLAGSPAQAAETSWADPQGDATGLIADSTPRPNDSQLDILKTSWSADGKMVTLVMHLDSATGEPVASAGRDYRFYFTYKDTEWAVGAQLPITPLDTAFIQGPIFVNDTDGEYLECGGCKLKFDEKAKTFTVTATYDTFDRAFPGTDKVGAGTKFTGLRSEAARFMGLIVPVDISTAPETTNFTF